MNKTIVGVVLGIIVYIGLKYKFIDIIILISLILGLYELINIRNKVNLTTSLKIVYSIAIIVIVSVYYMISSNIITNKDIIFILLAVCISDIFQEVTGKYLKIKHKIGWISPNKTYEGYIGGYIGILILALSFYKDKFILLNLIYILGVIGDLFFSYIKRIIDIKDYSNILLSHGGMLDRLDSLIFAILGYGLLKLI